MTEKRDVYGLDLSPLLHPCMAFRRGCVPIDDAISFIFMTRVIRQEKARALLLRFLSLHNYEILRCIVVIGYTGFKKKLSLVIKPSPQCIYTHDGDSCTGCKLSTVEACSRSTCATTSSPKRVDLERYETGEHILGPTRDPSKTSARWLLGTEEPSRESSATCPRLDSAHTNLSKSKRSQEDSIVRAA